MIKKIIAASAIGFFLLSGIAFAEATDVKAPQTEDKQTTEQAPADKTAKAPEVPKAPKAVEAEVKK